MEIEKVLERILELEAAMESPSNADVKAMLGVDRRRVIDMLEKENNNNGDENGTGRLEKRRAEMDENIIRMVNIEGRKIQEVITEEMKWIVREKLFTPGTIRRIYLQVLEEMRQDLGGKLDVLKLFYKNKEVMTPMMILTSRLVAEKAYNTYVRRQGKYHGTNAFRMDKPRPGSEYGSEKKEDGIENRTHLMGQQAGVGQGSGYDKYIKIAKRSAAQELDNNTNGILYNVQGESLWRGLEKDH
ncbi:hypothetical protein AX774_g1136 [Zancudomyces culisetae]|uniref:Uncharacterized protein n=1 Tax=Zancudomyces culisetae TaxID=1213189 RepID=A0A1R1PWI1_ZANCU|nr:hypothetical protein AX774_g1136 [Zancudomyces culisetae]|eukprot:OMH85330.1 hypothetical protein AX774_g1136 [Zancudomyces culisetae]